MFWLTNYLQVELALYVLCSLQVCFDLWISYDLLIVSLYSNLHFPLLPKSYILWHDHLLISEYSQQLLYSMDFHWNKILLTWIFGEKQMKGDFDIYHSKYFLFLKKMRSFTVVWGFQLCLEPSEENCLRMELIFPKLCMFHSLFLYHPQLKMNEDSGIQTLSFCGPWCCSGGNCQFLLLRCTWRYEGESCSAEGGGCWEPIIKSRAELASACSCPGSCKSAGQIPILPKPNSDFIMLKLFRRADFCRANWLSGWLHATISVGQFYFSVPLG